MNSKDKQSNGILQDGASGSNSISNADSNANVNSSADRSKGAIPKTKTLKPNSATQKKTLKLNNNVEEMQTLNGSASTTDIIKLNGYTNGFSVPNAYLDSYNSSLFDSSELCENTDMIGTSSCNSFKKSTDINYFRVDYGLNTMSVDENKPKRDSDNSSDDTELLSLSDDGCIYTYKGDNVADLPESFFSIDIPPLENNDVPDRRDNSSPEMDFLEMDFDPGQSGDVDSDSVSNADMDCGKAQPVEVTKEGKSENTSCLPSNNTNINNNETAECKQFDLPKPSTSTEVKSIDVAKVGNEKISAKVVEPVQMPWSCMFSQRTTSISRVRTVRKHHNASGELISPTEQNTASPTVPKSPSDYKLVSEQYLNEEVKNVMIWTEQEAQTNQVTQIGASACGATAVLNVLNALRFPLPTRDKIQEVINTRLRANSSPLVDYLLSRSVAGTTHCDLISGIHKLSNGQIYARFFPMYPERVVNLYKWLAFWIENGAVPIATLNLQKNIVPVPDAWHHQMIFGVGPKGIYLANPIECVEAGQLWPQLCSESVLLVRREDVLQRWSPGEMQKLMSIKDVRWRKMNVVGKK